MIKKMGLGFKTFIFTFVLITLVITVSFGILYFTLPSYYLRLKSKTLGKNVATLEQLLNEASTEEECASLISDFATSNNSNVISFHSDNSFIPELSSPFLLMNNTGGKAANYRFIERVKTDGTEAKMTVISQFDEQQPSGKSSELQLKIGVTDYIGEPVLIGGETSTALLIKYLQNNFIGYITITSTLQPIDEAKNVLISLFPYLLLLDFIIALAGAYIFAKQLTNPIVKISDAAAMMREMKPDVLSSVRTGDELGLLSYNLDSLYLSLCENIQNLQSEMDKTAKLEQSKTDFMRAAGHELKTPIAALNGIVEGMIDNVGVYKNREKYLDESKAQILKLSKLVNEILMSSQLEHVEESIDFDEASLGAIVDEAIGMYEILIEKKQLQVVKDAIDFTYRTDEHILLNTLSNLISNAVNYTANGEKIIISFTNTGDENILSIENQCSNIDDELIPKLFEPFFTLNYSRNRTESGTGLGLYIVKKNLDALKLPFKIENTDIGIKISIVFG